MSDAVRTHSSLVISQGADWLALNKPAGMSTHNDASSGGAGLDALAAAKEFIAEKQGVHAAATVSPVHRLDRETSGVLLFALTKEAASRLQQAIDADSTRKFYRAIARGQIATNRAWTYPISDKAEGRENPAGRASDRKNAETRFEVTRSTAYFTELKIELMTGRQHQIRKHARLAKHGLVGDTRYGEKGHAQKIAQIYGVSRLMLHAERLEIDGLVIEAPLPLEFDRLFTEMPAQTNERQTP